MSNPFFSGSRGSGSNRRRNFFSRNNPPSSSSSSSSDDIPTNTNTRSNYTNRGGGNNFSGRGNLSQSYGHGNGYGSNNVHGFNNAPQADRNRGRGGDGRGGGRGGFSHQSFHPEFQFDYDDGGPYGNAFRNFGGRGQGVYRGNGRGGGSNRGGGNAVGPANVNTGGYHGYSQERHPYYDNTGAHHENYADAESNRDSINIISGDITPAQANNGSGDGNGNGSYNGNRGATGQTRGGLQEGTQVNTGHGVTRQQINNSGGSQNSDGINNANDHSRHHRGNNQYQYHRMENIGDEDMPFTPPNPNRRTRHPHVRAIYGGRDSHPPTLNDIPARDWTPPPGWANRIIENPRHHRRHRVGDSRLSSPQEVEESPTRRPRIPTRDVLESNSSSPEEYRNNVNNRYWTNSSTSQQPAPAPPPQWQLTEAALSYHNNETRRSTAPRPRTIDERRYEADTEDGISNPPPPYEAPPSPESPAPTYRSHVTGIPRPQYRRVPSNSSTFDALLPEMAAGTSIMTSGDLFIDGNGLPSPWGRTPLNETEASRQGLGLHGQHGQATPAVVRNSNEEPHNPFTRSTPRQSAPLASVGINTPFEYQSQMPADSLNTNSVGIDGQVQTIFGGQSTQASTSSGINNPRQNLQNITSFSTLSGNFIDDQDPGSNPWADNLRLATPVQMLQRNPRYTPRWMRGWDADTYPTEFGREWSSANAWALNPRGAVISENSNNVKNRSSNNPTRNSTPESETSDPTTPRAASTNIVVVVTPPQIESREEFADPNPRATVNQTKEGETQSIETEDSGSGTTKISGRTLDTREDITSIAHETMEIRNVNTSPHQRRELIVNESDEIGAASTKTRDTEETVEDDEASEYEDVSDDEGNDADIGSATATSRNTSRPVTLHTGQGRPGAGPSRHTVANPLGDESQRLKRRSLSVSGSPLKRNQQQSRVYTGTPHGANRRSIIGSQNRVGKAGNRVSVIGSPQKPALSGGIIDPSTSTENKKYSIGGTVKKLFKRKIVPRESAKNLASLDSSAQTPSASTAAGPSLTKKKSFADTLGNLSIFSKKKPQQPPMVISGPIGIPNIIHDEDAEAVRKAIFEGAGIQFVDRELASYRYRGQAQGSVLGGGAVVVDSPTSMDIANCEQKPGASESMRQENGNLRTELETPSVTPAVQKIEVPLELERKPTYQSCIGIPGGQTSSLRGDRGPSSPTAGGISGMVALSNLGNLHDEGKADGHQSAESMNGSVSESGAKNVSTVKDGVRPRRFMTSSVLSDRPQSTNQRQKEDSTPNPGIVVTTKVSVGEADLGPQDNDINDPFGFERKYRQSHEPPSLHKGPRRGRLHKLFRSINGSLHGMGWGGSSDSVLKPKFPSILDATKKKIHLQDQSRESTENALPILASPLKSPVSMLSLISNPKQEEPGNGPSLQKNKPGKDSQSQGRSIPLLRKATSRALTESRHRRKTGRELQETDLFQAMGSPLEARKPGKVASKTPDSKVSSEVRATEGGKRLQIDTSDPKEEKTQNEPTVFFSPTDGLSVPDLNTPTMSGKADNREVTFERLRYLQRMRDARRGSGIKKQRPKSIVRTPRRENSSRRPPSRHVTQENTTIPCPIDVQESSGTTTPIATDVQIPGFLDPFVETYTRETLNATLTTRPRPNQVPDIASERPAPNASSRNLPTNQLRPLWLPATLRNQTQSGQPQTPVAPITSQVSETNFSQAPTLADSRYLMPSPLRNAEVKRAEIRRNQNRYAQMYHPDPEGYNRYHQQQRQEHCEGPELETADDEEEGQVIPRNPPPAFSLLMPFGESENAISMMGCTERGEQGETIGFQESESGEESVNE